MEKNNFILDLWEKIDEIVTVDFLKILILWFFFTATIHKFWFIEKTKLLTVEIIICPNYCPTYSFLVQISQRTHTIDRRISFKKPLFRTQCTSKRTDLLQLGFFDRSNNLFIIRICKKVKIEGKFVPLLREHLQFKASKA